MTVSSLASHTRRGIGALFLGFGMALVPIPVAANADDLENTEFLADLSLEELLNTEITTLSRKAESLGSAPAAVYVISENDIRRSGARTIPDLLRMVPGMQVAQIDGNKWAVTSRGANGRFANKLLVLMDGRTLYSPILSGVYWDEQDTDLDAIERIEVIRGPGATMWGSNAVNGVVNIITKHAGDTLGGNLSVVGGARGAESALRFGDETEDLAYRVYAKAFDRDGNVNLAGDDVDDDYRMFRIGGRLDWESSAGTELTITGEAYDGEAGEYGITRSLVPPYTMIEGSVDEISGGFALARWSRELETGSNLGFKAYYSVHDRDGSPLSFKQETFDLDIQHRIVLTENSDVMWGINYRRNEDSTEGTFAMQLDPASYDQDLISGFVQGDFRVFDDSARLIVGSKFEHNSFSDKRIEIEPSVRLSMPVAEQSTVWMSVSRAVRMPSRGEQFGLAASEVLPPGQPELPLPVPTVILFRGSQDMASEDVTAYELGYRMRNNDLLVDVALFYNDFENLRSFGAGVPTCQPGGGIPQLDPACLATATYVEMPFRMENNASSKTTGVELLVSSPVNEWWRLEGQYTYFHAFDSDSISVDSFGIEDSPDHQFSLRSLMDLPRDFTADVWLRWVDELEAQQVDAYTALDIRIAWSPTPSLSIAGVGRNLIADDHIEFLSELADLAPVQIEMEAYIELHWRF